MKIPMKIPKGLRKGQAIWAFLYYYKRNQLVDIFYIDDKTFDRIWKEFVKEYEASTETEKEKQKQSDNR